MMAAMAESRADARVCVRKCVCVSVNGSNDQREDATGSAIPPKV